MTTVINGSYPAVNSDSDATINGLTVGKGGGSVASNTAVGLSALTANTTGALNTAIGYQAGYTNTTGNSATFVGRYAGLTNNADNNTAVGESALRLNTTGVENAAFGTGALFNNSTGSYNTGIGRSALNQNTTASNNTAVGYQAGYSNTTGGYNTAIGQQALYSNTTAYDNVAVGYQALFNSNRTADTAGWNTAVGLQAGYALTTGQANTFIGHGTGSAITTGSNNTIIGAAYTGNGGGLDIRTASNYIVLSDGAGNPRGIFDNNGKFLLGGVTSAYSGNGISISSSQNTIWTNCTNSGQNGLVVQNSANGTGTSASLVAFNVGTAGGGTTIGSISYNGSLTLYNSTSDQRLKENIVDADTALETINKIKIRAFDWIESKTHETHGVIAQELQQVAPQCVTKGIDNLDGSMDRPWQVDTSPLVPMLIKAIQELKAEVDSLKQQLGK